MEREKNDKLKAKIKIETAARKFTKRMNEPKLVVVGFLFLLQWCGVKEFMYEIVCVCMHRPTTTTKKSQKGNL